MSCSSISLNFELSEHLPDTPEYARISTEECVRRTLAFRSLTRVFAARPDGQAYWEDYSRTRWAIYLHEALVGEGNIRSEATVDDVEAALVGAASALTEREQTKVQSLDKALHLLFDHRTLAVKAGLTGGQVLSATWISQLHAAVCENLLPAGDLGTFRVKYAKPAKENWLYLAPHLIAKNLEKLCVRAVQQQEQIAELADPATKLVQSVKLAAAFAVSFLQIHPFRNGNGRVARLLVSFVLRDVSVVPVPLTTKVNSREKYLEYIRGARNLGGGGRYVPQLLARCILEAVHLVQSDAVAVLDLLSDSPDASDDAPQ